MKIRKFGQLSLKKIQKIEASNQKLDLNHLEEPEFDAIHKKNGNNKKFQAMGGLSEETE